MLTTTSLLLRRLGFAAAVAGAGVELMRTGWDGASTDPAAPIDRVGLIAIVVALVLLPLIAGHRLAFGPVANGWARLVRVGAYGALWLLPVVAGDLSRFAGARFEGHTSRAERVNSAITGSVVLFVLIVGYAIGILWITSRRSSASAATLAIGAGLGVVSGLAVYALTPFGGFLHVRPWLAPFYYVALFLATLGAPFVAGKLAGDRTADPDESSTLRLAQGIRAGLCTGGVAALLIALLTIPTMVHFPNKVALVWANPDPHVAHGGTFEVQMSVGDGAQKYLALLLVVPFLAAGLGAVGSEVRRQPQPQRPRSGARGQWASSKNPDEFQ